MSDLIDRGALLDELWKQRRNYQMMDDTQTADKIMHGLYRAEQVVKEAPTVFSAPRWHRVEEPPKEDGAYAVGWLYPSGCFYWCKLLFLNGEWQVVDVPEPDYWMPIEPPKEGEG